MFRLYCSTALCQYLYVHNYIIFHFDNSTGWRKWIVLVEYLDMCAAMICLLTNMYIVQILR